MTLDQLDRVYSDAWDDEYRRSQDESKADDVAQNARIAWLRTNAPELLTDTPTEHPVVFAWVRP